MIPIPHRVHSETLPLSNPSIWTDNTTQTRKFQVKAFLFVYVSGDILGYPSGDEKVDITGGGVYIRDTAEHLKLYRAAPITNHCISTSRHCPESGKL